MINSKHCKGLSCIKCTKLTLIILFGIIMETLNLFLLYHQKDEVEYHTPSGGAIAFMKIIEDIHWKIILIIIYFTFPLSKSYSVTLVVFYSVLLSNLFKIWYSPFRLFRSHVSFVLFRTDYAFISASLYPSVYHLLIDTERLSHRTCSKVFLLIFILLLLGSMNLLNFYCAFDFIAQIIHEMSFGFIIYFIVFHLLEMHQYDSYKFIDTLLDTKYIILNTALFSACILILFLSYFLIDVIKEMKDLNFIAFNKALSFFGLIGAYYGCCLFSFITLYKYDDKHDEINNWIVDDSKSKTSKVFIILKIIGLHFFVWFIPNEYYELASIFKIAIPFFTVMFSMYGLAIYVFVKMKMNNPDDNEGENRNIKLKKKKYGDSSHAEELV